MNLSGRRRTLLIIAVLVVIVLGVAAVALGLGNLGDDDDDGGGAAPVTTTSTAPFEFSSTTTVPVSDTTTTTTGPATTTTAAPATTTTTRGSTSTTSTTLAASPSSCGTGQASVSFNAKDLVNTAIDSSFTPEAVVSNQVSQPIEVEEIILDVTYPDGSVRTVRFSTSGTIVAPGTSASFTAEKLTTARRYENVRFTRFTYFIQGQAANCRVTTP